jgi:hypothetical protein
MLTDTKEQSYDPLLLNIIGVTVALILGVSFLELFLGDVVDSLGWPLQYRLLLYGVGFTCLFYAAYNCMSAYKRNHKQEFGHDSETAANQALSNAVSTIAVVPTPPSVVVYTGPPATKQRRVRAVHVPRVGYWVRPGSALRN